MWVQLDFKNVDKTRTHIQRSKSSPLEIQSRGDDAFTLAIPHIHRLKSLTHDSYALPNVLKTFHHHTPLLEKLDIHISTGKSILNDALLSKDLSSPRYLRLNGITPRFPCTNLANLRVVDLKTHWHEYGTTQILDFFKSAPFLHTVSLQYSMPHLSDAPPGRIVAIRHLKALTIDSNPPHSIIFTFPQEFCSFCSSSLAVGIAGF